MNEKSNKVASLGESKEEHIQKCVLYRERFSAVALDSDINLATPRYLNTIRSLFFYLPRYIKTILSKITYVKNIVSSRQMV